MAVPAGLFCLRRRPAFPFYDELGARAVIDAHWVQDALDETVYIDRAHAEAFQEFLRTSLSAILDDRAVAAADRGWAVHRALLHEVALLFGGASAHMRPNTLVTIAREVARLILEHGDPTALFASIRRHTPYAPVVHAIETAIGAISLAIADGQRESNFLAMLGAGAVFADVGMLDLPASIRTASGPLKPTERRVMQCHRGISLRRMRALGLASPVAERAVGAHHERWDGEGYPGRLRGEDIPIEARYVAVADTYSTLTVPHRGIAGLERAAALAEIAQSAGQFDPRIAGHLVRLLARA
ncbi:MAG: HD domain-containing protein [Dehalococcoidia bacterium]|nr:HD domain-containing protein [Dehalococcoidia bacterium]